MDRFLTKIEQWGVRRLTHRKALKVAAKAKERTLLGEIWGWIDALLFAVFWVIILNQYLFQFFVIPSPSMVHTLEVGDRVLVMKGSYGTELYPAGKKVGAKNRNVQRDHIITFYNPEYESKGPFFDLASQAVFMGTFGLVNIDRNPDGSMAERLYVKRAAAMSGDEVRFVDGDVYIRPAGFADFIPEDEFREMNGLSQGPHRKNDMELYGPLHAFSRLKAYENEGMMAKAPKYLFDEYSKLTPENQRNIFDQYEIEHGIAEMESEFDPSNMMRRSDASKYERGIYVPEDHVLPLGDNRDNSRDGRYFGPVEESKVNGRVVFRFWPFSRINVLADK